MVSLQTIMPTLNIKEITLPTSLRSATSPIKRGDFVSLRLKSRRQSRPYLNVIHRKYGL